MPFGLVYSGATFPRMMHKLLRGFRDGENFVDDIFSILRSLSIIYLHYITFCLDLEKLD